MVGYVSRDREGMSRVGAWSLGRKREKMGRRIRRACFGRGSALSALGRHRGLCFYSGGRGLGC